MKQPLINDCIQAWIGIRDADGVFHPYVRPEDSLPIAFDSAVHPMYAGENAGLVFDPDAEAVVDLYVASSELQLPEDGEAVQVDGNPVFQRVMHRHIAGLGEGPYHVRLEMKEGKPLRMVLHSGEHEEEVNFAGTLTDEDVEAMGPSMDRDM